MVCAKLSTSIYKSILVMALVVMYSIGVYAESVAHRFESDEPETRTENILYLSAGTALSSIGFSSTRESRGSDFILHTRYAQHDDEISVLYTLYSKNERILSEKSLVAPLDHQLDIRIGETLAELFDEAEARGYSEDAGISDLFSWKQDASGPVAPDPRSSPAFVFESGAEIGGVVFFGEFGEYFSYGAGGSLSAGVTWRRKTWRFTAGVKAGTIRVFEATGVSGPTLLLSTAGPVVMFGTGANKSYRFSGFVSGGAGVISLLDSGTLTSKTVPYADAGMLALMPLGDLLYYGARLSFLTWFDQDSIITGAGASIVLELEL